MAHFLRLTGFLESLEEIDQAVRYIEHLFSLGTEERRVLLDRLSERDYRATYEGEIRRALATIQTQVQQLCAGARHFRSEPFVFTGSASTDDVLDMLERAVSGRRPARPQADRHSGGRSAPTSGPAEPEGPVQLGLLEDLPLALRRLAVPTRPPEEERPMGDENPRPAPAKGVKS